MEKITRGHLGKIVPIYPYTPHDIVKNNPLAAGKYHSIINLVDAFHHESGEVVTLESYAEKAWEDNAIQLVGGTITRPKKYYDSFEEFKDFYIKRYIYKTAHTEEE